MTTTVVFTFLSAKDDYSRLQSFLPFSAKDDYSRPVGTGF